MGPPERDVIGASRPSPIFGFMSPVLATSQNGTVASRGNPVLGRIGALSVRLATDESDVRRAQALRHDVFVEECGAARAGRENGLEVDAYDVHCDHLLVVDTARDEVVGTYRLMTQDAARRAGGFYSAGEFDVAAMLARHPERRFLELGRSCVHPDHRNRRTIELLWQGAWAYALDRGTDVMFGCASLPGTGPSRHRAALAYLAENALSAEAWQVRARADGVSLTEFTGTGGNVARMLAALPPLVKGYLRLGGRIGPEAVIDRDFGCLDVMVVLPHESISPRYIAHYGEDASRFA